MRAALAVARVAPRPLARGTGALLGRFARDVLRLRRGTTESNLAIAFPEMGPEERSDIARRMYAHFGRMAVDSLRLSAAGPATLVPHVEGGEAVELLRERLARGRGAIILTGHVGNWEMAGAYMAARGFPLAAVVKPPANPYVARHTEAVRRGLGIETIPMPEARTGVMAALGAGKAVALVADQGALRSTTWVPFFGRQTRTPAGPGVFASRSGAPVLFGALLARPDGGFRLVGEVIEEEVAGGADDAVERIARVFRERLEALVRQVPEQYLWTHRLWKHSPPSLAAPEGRALT